MTTFIIVIGFIFLIISNLSLGFVYLFMFAYALIQLLQKMNTKRTLKKN